MSNVKLVSKSSIAGVVTDRLTGYPLSGVTVKITGTEFLTRTGIDGFYFFTDLPEGTYSLTVAAKEYGSRYGIVEVSGVLVSMDLRGRPQFDTSADVSLPVTCIRGTIRNSSGIAVSGAHISVVADEKYTISAVNGTFTLAGLYEGHPTIRVSADGFRPFIQQVELHAGAVTELNASLAT